MAWVTNNQRWCESWRNDIHSSTKTLGRQKQAFRKQARKIASCLAHKILSSCHSKIRSQYLFEADCLDRFLPSCIDKRNVQKCGQTLKAWLFKVAKAAASTILKYNKASKIAGIVFVISFFTVLISLKTNIVFTTFVTKDFNHHSQKQNHKYKSKSK